MVLEKVSTLSQYTTGLATGTLSSLLVFTQLDDLVHSEEGLTLSLYFGEEPS